MTFFTSYRSRSISAPVDTVSVVRCIVPSAAFLVCNGSVQTGGRPRRRVLDRHREADADEHACSVGFRMAVTMPTTSPSAVTSGPPELPGLTAASNWIRLVRMRLPSCERNSRRRPDTTPDDADGPMPNGNPPRRPRRPLRDRRVDRMVAAARSSGIVLACSTARSCSGRMPGDHRVRFGSVGEDHLDPVRGSDHMQVGEYDALVDDDHAGADADLHVLADRSADQAPHAHD